MRHLKSGRKLGRRTDHRKAMIKNLTESLVIHGRIETTVTRAKEVRTYVEPLITKAKEGTLHARRIVASRLHTEAVAKKIFEELGVQFADRPGGYTRILKTGNRKGDAAPMAILELVFEPIAKKSKSKKAKKEATPKAVASPERGATEQDPGQQEEQTVTESEGAPAASGDIPAEAAPESLTDTPPEAGEDDSSAK